MARDKHQTQKAIANLVIHSRFQIWNVFLLDLELAAQLRLLAFEPLPAAKEIDRVVLRGPHQPGSGLFRNT